MLSCTIKHLPAMVARYIPPRCKPCTQGHRNVQAACYRTYCVQLGRQEHGHEHQNSRLYTTVPVVHRLAGRRDGHLLGIAAIFEHGITVIGGGCNDGNEFGVGIGVWPSLRPASQTTAPHRHVLPSGLVHRHRNGGAQSAAFGQPIAMDGFAGVHMWHDCWMVATPMYRNGSALSQCPSFPFKPIAKRPVNIYRPLLFKYY